MLSSVYGCNPWRIRVHDHPGSTVYDIRNEPNWTGRHLNRIGFVNRDGRRPGLTDIPRDDDQQSGEDDDDYEDEIEQARRKLEELREEVDAGNLVNFRDIVEHQHDFHIAHPENRSLGWRYVLNTSEDWVKNQENWPANLRRKEVEEQRKGQEDDGVVTVDTQEEHEWRASEKNKHHDAQHVGAQQLAKEESEKAATDIKEMYTPQERALLEVLQNEQGYICSLKQSDGKKRSPQTHNRSSITIDEQDQFTPDNWLPRCPELIRIGGKHPMNAEPSLTRLFDSGLITPNELHYVRNHGAVPRLMWEFHKLDIEYADHLGEKRLSLSMNDLKNNYRGSVINIPVAMMCTGNRRKELNLIRKSKGLNNGAATVGCAYWRGPLLRDVLLSAGVPETLPERNDCTRYWVNFAGADSLGTEGHTYETSIPFEYAMDPTNDVILAQEMNDLPLPADYGYPVRVMIPGQIGGRCVKWLRRIWISDHENNSHYHIWDNRLLPPFVTEKDGQFAEALFRNPDTACYEQILNSVITKPAHGEKIVLENVKNGESYRIQGYAFDGGGREVQRVEVSLDGGKTWLYAVRKFPDFPIRHGNKFWTWLHWHVDVELSHLVRASSIVVRAFNASKSTQPEHPQWNVLGMMNNAWYMVKPEMVASSSTEQPSETSSVVIFRHPTEPGSGESGWMKPSAEARMAQAKQDEKAPKKQFTREEIEKHGSPESCWLVVDNKVYDATSVLDWHPGGKASILAHAGKCERETTDLFTSIHDDFAWKKLNECILGRVTEKTANFIRQSAEEAAKEKAASHEMDSNNDLALQRHRWVPVRLVGRRKISSDTNTYTFALPENKTMLGLETCQHVQIGFHLRDRMLIRQYTPTRPLLPVTVTPGPPKASHAQVVASTTTAKKKAKKKKKQNGRQEGIGNGNELEVCTADRREHLPPAPPPNTPADSLSRAGSLSGSSSTGLGSLVDGQGDGTFDLTIKTYLPTGDQPGGAMSNILDCMPLGSEVEIRGPTGDIVYQGNGFFRIEGQPPRHFKRVSIVLGGSGITPGYALMARIVLAPGDNTEVRVVDANKTEEDILLRDELDKLEKIGRQKGGQVCITHVLSRPEEAWTGERGVVNERILKTSLFGPDRESVALLCGPPGLVQGAVLPVLREWGYCEDDNMFGF